MMDYLTFDEVHASIIVFLEQPGNFDLIYLSPSFENQ